jgi:hypothetical protein
MTFRKYSKFTSSSPCTLPPTSIEDRAEPVLDAAFPLAATALVGVVAIVGVPGRPNLVKSGEEAAGPCDSAVEPAPLVDGREDDAQYPIPGFLCRSRSAAED